MLGWFKRKLRKKSKDEPEEIVSEEKVDVAGKEQEDAGDEATQSPAPVIEEPAKDEEPELDTTEADQQDIVAEELSVVADSELISVDEEQVVPSQEEDQSTELADEPVTVAPEELVDVEEVQSEPVTEEREREEEPGEQLAVTEEDIFVAGDEEAASTEGEQQEVIEIIEEETVSVVAEYELYSVVEDSPIPAEEDRASEGTDEPVTVTPEELADVEEDETALKDTEKEKDQGEQPAVLAIEEEEITEVAAEELIPVAEEQAETVVEEEQPEATIELEAVEKASEQEPEPEPVATMPQPQDKPGKSMFQRLQERLGKTRDSLVHRMDTLFLGKKEIDQELLDDLEELLITADLGVATVQDLLDYASREVKRKELSDPAALKNALRERITEYLQESDQPAELVMPDEGPFVIMVIGVNGVGKTTTIGKIAAKFIQAGDSVLLIAGDTFRAAAIDQLKIWGERVGAEVVAQSPGADPSSVVFDGIEYGVAKDFDVIIMDTAGRLHTSVNLMEELKKIHRVTGKKMAGAPHEVMLVLDATTGQNAVSQARLFNEAVGITGLALTKLDGTAKGGIVANICREMKIPVRFIGIGEQMDDLRDFEPMEFVDALFQESENLEEQTA